MKRFFAVLLSTLLAELTLCSYNTLCFAQFTRRELGLRPTTFQRTGEIIWRYERIIPKRGDSFAYFSQNYSLDLWGPLVSPFLGQVKLDLEYAVGANVLGYPWISKEKQELLGYSVGTYFAPPFLERFFSLTTNFSRQRKEQFADSDLLTSVYLVTSRMVSCGFTPPWRINLFNRNNRSRRGKSSLSLGFPSIFYSYFYCNSTDELYQKASFDRDSITERYNVLYSFQRWHFEYRQQRNKEIDLLRGEEITRHDLTRDYNLTWRPTVIGRVISSVYFSGNYHQTEDLLVRGIYYDRAYTLFSLDFQTFKFLGLTHRPGYRNYFSWWKQAKTWSETNSFLMSSEVTLFRRVWFSNALTYDLSNSNSWTNFAHTLKERATLGTGFSPLPGWGVATWIDETYTFAPFPTSQEERWSTRLDLPRILFLGHSGQYTLSRTKDLVKKEVTAYNADTRYELGGQVSPLGYFLNGIFNYNNNRQNNKNNKNNKNNFYYDQLLTLRMNLGLGEEKNLLTRARSTYLSENYGLHSEPLNQYVIIDLSYWRSRRWGDGQPVSRQEYFDSSITLQAGRALFYRGIIIETQVLSRNLRDLNIFLGLRYEYGRSSFAFRYRAIAYGYLAPYQAYSLIFTRKI